MVYTTHLWKNWGWFTGKTTELWMSRLKRGGSFQLIPRLIKKSIFHLHPIISYSLGGGNPPKKNKTTPTWSNHQTWRSGDLGANLLQKTILPKQLAAILGMAALLIRAPTEFEMVGIHLFEPLAAGDVPWKPRDADASRKAAFDEESVLETN